MYFKTRFVDCQYVYHVNFPGHEEKMEGSEKKIYCRTSTLPKL